MKATVYEGAANPPAHVVGQKAAGAIVRHTNQMTT